jgi:hypothetical protein
MIYKIAKVITATAVAVTLAFAAGTPVQGSAVSTYRYVATSQKTFATTMTQVEPSLAYGVLTGVLKVSITKNGMVSGWYIADYGSGDFVPVIGNIKEGKLWLDIGDNGRLRVTADVRKGWKIVGTAVDLNVLSGPPVAYTFNATPAS